MQKKLKSSDLKVRVECEQKTEGLKNEQFSKLQTKDVGLANILSKIKDPLGLDRTAIGMISKTYCGTKSDSHVHPCYPGA